LPGGPAVQAFTTVLFFSNAQRRRHGRVHVPRRQTAPHSRQRAAPCAQRRERARHSAHTRAANPCVCELFVRSAGYTGAAPGRPRHRSSPPSARPASAVAPRRSLVGRRRRVPTTP